jgi:hypothetical protein
MKSYYGESCKTGDIFGLKVSDLTEEQLNKLVTKKLVEFLEVDPRVQAVLAARMNAVKNTADAQRDLSSVVSRMEDDDWDKYSEIKTAYNNTLESSSVFCSKSPEDYYWNRGSYYVWAGLNDGLRMAELERYVKGETNVVELTRINFDWVCNARPDLARGMFDRVLQGTTNNSASNLISKSTKDILLEFVPRILNHPNKYTRLLLLRSRFTPDECLDQLLKIYAKIDIYKIGACVVGIKSAIINNLPPITRLEVLERLVKKGNTMHEVFVDIKSTDDFRQFTFASLTRYPARVTDVITNFEQRWAHENAAALDIAV